MDRSTSASSSDAEAQRTAYGPAEPQSIVILGASARAAACSAVAGGWLPWCADLFADADLQALCPAQQVANYPQGLATAARSAPPGSWIYTGGLENHPALVDAIAAERPLWGNAGAVLRQVRDPFELADCLVCANLPCCDVRREPDGLRTDGTWLVKRQKSSGGSGVRVWSGTEAGLCADDLYYQQHIDGRPAAGVFVADGSRAMLLGVTEQLVGTDWLHARAFHYSGSLGPWDLSPRSAEQWQRIGQALAARFALRGLFGVDAIVRNGEVWPLEVNPRFPASVEVLERAGRFSAVALHVAACHGELPASPPAYHPGWHGKAIVFAPRSGQVSLELFAQAQAASRDRPLGWAADIPSLGTLVRAGAPILTVLAAGATRDQLIGRLARQAESFCELLPIRETSAV